MPIEILMPALSPTMKQGNLAKWNKSEGDTVNAGDVIAEIETDKATMEVEAVDEGVLGKIFVEAGSENIAVNSVIALLLEDGEDKKSIEDYKPKQVSNDDKKSEQKIEAEKNEPKLDSNKDIKVTQDKVKNESKIEIAAPITPVVTTSSLNKDVNSSPLAKRIAQENNINLSQLQGSGPKGRIIKQDVVDFMANSSNSNRIIRNPVEANTIKNNNIRKVIAERLVASKQTVPHFYLTIDANLDNLLAIRQQVNNAASMDENGKPLYKISINDMIIKSVALSLRDVPKANSSWTDEEIYQYNNVDVSVAVATDDGLITPIIFNADQRSLTNISSEMKILAKKARENKLQPHEFQGGGFSISNLGMYGVSEFAAIVNPPQACILAVGATNKKVIVDADDQITTANIINFTLSCDHRVVDGAVGAEFLGKFKFYIENPAVLIMN